MGGPSTLHARATTAHCSNCGTTSPGNPRWRATWSLGRCRPCYDYFHRTGHERPAAKWGAS